MSRSGTCWLIVGMVLGLAYSLVGGRLPLAPVALSGLATVEAGSLLQVTPFPTQTLYLPLLVTQRCMTAEQEPNDEFAEAQRNPPACINANILGYIPYNDEQDIYRVQLLAGGRLVIDLSTIPSNTDLDLLIYDTSYSLLAQSRLPNQEPEHVEVLLGGGTYYIKVLSFARGYNRFDPYTLRWTLQPTALGDASAPIPLEQSLVVADEQVEQLLPEVDGRLGGVEADSP